MEQQLPQFVSFVESVLTQFIVIYFWEGVGRISGMCELLKVLELIYVYIKKKKRHHCGGSVRMLIHLSHAGQSAEEGQGRDLLEMMQAYISPQRQNKTIKKITQNQHLGSSLSMLSVSDLRSISCATA